MAGTFTNRKKLVMLAAAVFEKMAYIKNADSLFPEAELKGKKYGMKVSTYLADPGTVHDGIVATADKIHEVEVFAWMKNKNTAVEVDLWDELNNIEDFKKEITSKRAGKLAREVQLAVLGENVFRSCQAVASATSGFSILTDASSALDELAVDGDLVTFLRPTLHGKIAEGGLSKFLPSEKMKDIYEDNYLGQYAGSAQVELAGMPVLDTTGACEHPTITVNTVKDSGGNVIGLKPTSTIVAGSAELVVGVPYVVEGLKIVDESGIETDQDYVVIVTAEQQFDAEGNASTVVGIPELRVTAKGKGYGNPNAYMAAAALGSGDTVTLTLSPMTGITIGKKYDIGQCRTIKALSFDQYRFEDLPAAKQENVGTFENITLKAQSAPQILNGVAVTRIDMPFLAKIFEPRRSVTVYVEKT